MTSNISGHPPHQSIRKCHGLDLGWTCPAWLTWVTHFEQYLYVHLQELLQGTLQPSFLYNLQESNPKCQYSCHQLPIIVLLLSSSGNQQNNQPARQSSIDLAKSRSIFFPAKMIFGWEIAYELSLSMSSKLMAYKIHFKYESVGQNNLHHPVSSSQKPKNEHP